jgi:hypothetical protein
MPGVWTCGAFVKALSAKGQKAGGAVLKPFSLFIFVD